MLLTRGRPLHHQICAKVQRGVTGDMVVVEFACLRVIFLSRLTSRFRIMARYKLSEQIQTPPVAVKHRLNRYVHWLVLMFCDNPH